jgi:outer membrane receptor protein involved in Fe transport
MTTSTRILLATGLCSAAATLGMAQTVSATNDQPVQAEPFEVSATRLPASATTTTQVDLLSQTNPNASAANLNGEAANFYVASSGARSFTDTFALRGLANTPIFGDPDVTVYLDDMPLATGFTFPSDLVGFNSAILYRGPEQNTRFGRAGTVGVLQFSTQTANGVVNELRGHYGNYDDRGFELQGGAKADGVDVYAAAGYDARDGYITNTTLNRKIDGRESSSALAKLHVAQGSNGDWTLLATAQRVRDGVQPLVPLEGPKFSVQRSEEGITHIEDWGVSLRGSFDTDLGKLSTTTSYTDWRMGPATNALNFGFAELEDNSLLHERAWTEEINLVSTGHDRWHGSAGFFALGGKTQGAFIRSFGGFPYENSNYTTNHRQLAGFGEADFQVNSALTITAGMRLEGNWKKIDRLELVPDPGNFYSHSSYSSAFLPKVFATYKIDQQTEADFGFTTGYKPGGFSSFTGNPALSKFDSERLHGFEGAITQTDHKTWSATLRGFAYWIRGYQIERSFQTNDASDDYMVVNAPRARSYGAEIEVDRHLGDGWSVGGSFGYTNVTLRDFVDPYTGDVYNGKRAPYAPLFNGNVHVEYRDPTGWFARVEEVGIGRVFYTEGEDTTFSQKSYFLLNARLGYETQQYRVMVYGDNLTNREYFAAITPGTNHGTPGDPRTYGVEVEWKF